MAMTPHSGLFTQAPLRGLIPDDPAHPRPETESPYLDMTVRAARSHRVRGLPEVPTHSPAVSLSNRA